MSAWFSTNMWRFQTEQKGGGKADALCLSGDIRLLLPRTPTLLTLRPLDSDLELPHWLPGSQAFRLELDYTTSLPRPPACGWQILELLSFHNSVSQLFIISLFIEKSRDRETEILLVLFLWRSPNNSEHQLHHLLTRWPKTNGIASLSLSLSIYIYIHTHTYIYIYIYIYILVYSYTQSMGSQSWTQLSTCKHTHKKPSLARELGSDRTGVLTDTMKQARGSSRPPSESTPLHSRAVGGHWLLCRDMTGLVLIQT